MGCDIILLSRVLVERAGKLRPIWRVHSCNNIPASVAPAPVMPAMRWHTIIITINIPGRPSDTTQRCALTRPATAGAVLCVCVFVTNLTTNPPAWLLGLCIKRNALMAPCASIGVCASASVCVYTDVVVVIAHLVDEL